MTPELLEQRMARVVDPARVAVRAPLAPYTTFRIGGPADVLVEVTSADELAAAVAVAREAGVPWFVLGLGANILVGDRGFRGVVIRNRARAFTLDATGRLVAESGAEMEALVLGSVRAGWSGLEHYIGIPSTVGGALWQNLHFLSPAPARASSSTFPTARWSPASWTCTRIPRGAGRNTESARTATCCRRA